MRICKFFKKKPISVVNGELIFFHEDFYCQIELIPIENYFNVKKQFDQIPDPDSTLGFRSTKIREQTFVSLIDRRILLSAITSTLNNLSSSFSTNIESGYSSTTYKIENSQVWGFDYYGIFVEYKKNILSKIWLLSHHTFSKNNSGLNLKEALLYLCQSHNLVLVDWNKKIVVRFNQHQEIDNYLKEELRFDLNS